MGLFDGAEKKLLAERDQLRSEIADLRTKLETKKSDIEVELENLKKNLADTLVLVNQSSLSLIALLVRFIGLSSIATSLIFVYFIATKENFSFGSEVAWAIYLFSQFSGLYLLGYGRTLTIHSFQLVGVYLTVLFLAITIAIILALFSIIPLNITNNTLGLECVNSIGIWILVYIERKVIFIRSGRSRL